MIIELRKSNTTIVYDNYYLHIININTLNVSYELGPEGLKHFTSFLEEVSEIDSYVDSGSCKYKLSSSGRPRYEFIIFWAEKPDEGFRNIGIDYGVSRVIFNLHQEDIKKLYQELKGIDITNL